MLVLISLPLCPEDNTSTVTESIAITCGAENILTRDGLLLLFNTDMHDYLNSSFVSDMVFPQKGLVN